jgi:hypothetical protein
MPARHKKELRPPLFFPSLGRNERRLRLAVLMPVPKKMFDLSGMTTAKLQYYGAT